MKIFLTGASGYIGRAVAEKLAQAGLQVFGLTHSPDKAKKLDSSGMQAVIGDIKEPVSYRKQLDSCEVLIHTAFEYSKEGIAADRTILEALIDSVQSAKSPRLLIYTSGVWVLGGQKGKPMDENTPVNPAPGVAFRPAHEQLALASAGKNVSAVVIRPGCVYGGAGGLYAEMIKSAVEEKSIRIVGDGNNCWATVSLSDLAEFYRLVVEKRPQKELFHATDGSSELVSDVAEAFLKHAGGGRVSLWPLDEARKKLGVFADALALDQRVSSEKAKRHLGWTPKLKSAAKYAPDLVAQWRDKNQPAGLTARRER